MTQTREKFATQVRSDLLTGVREIATNEGRQLQALVDEAFADLIEKRRGVKARPHVLAALRHSHARYSALYKKLAR